MNDISDSPVGTVVAGGEPKITIRIIGRCNFHCPACSTGSHPDRTGLLTFADFRQIVAMLVSEDFHGVVNISGGEPTLHPRLVAMVRHIAHSLPAARIVVFTNGSWVGRPWWRKKLRALLAGDNVLVRMSLDRQHAEGEIRAAGRVRNQASLAAVEGTALERARLFLDACLACGARPGRNFDFAFKGDPAAAEAYMAPLGKVPVYCIAFQPNPKNRPRQFGYFGVDIDAAGTPSVYPTLGHILANEPLGGIEALPAAMKINRAHVRAALTVPERNHEGN